MTTPKSAATQQSVNDDEIAAQLGELVLRLSRRLRRGSAQRLGPFGLSDGQARVLRMVGRSRVPLHMSEIARRIEIVPRSATTIVEGLEKKELVVREIDTEDRRSILVRLTPKGAQLIDELGRVRDAVAAQMFHQLEWTDRVELLRLLVVLDSADGHEQPLSPSGESDGREIGLSDRRWR